MVPPGGYRVKMTTGSFTDEEPLTLTMDPRLVADEITAADLREQYEHNNRMRDMVAEIGNLVNRVRQARTNDAQRPQSEISRRRSSVRAKGFATVSPGCRRRSPISPA